MSNFLTKAFGKLFGTKQDKDLGTYEPLVETILAEWNAIRELSHDELRAKTLEFRQKLKQDLAEIDLEIAAEKSRAEQEPDPVQKEEIFKGIDALIKQRDEYLEDSLKEILPQAFAVVKETARRFTENEELVVNATPHDRELAGRNKSYVRIEGEKAIWKNKWMAAGGEITWNMVHYDVQLIGGMVLHDGKIAEMATGEGKTLVATLPAYLNGVTGEGVHIVTVNDYLARRDSEWVGPIFEFLLLTVDCIDKYKPHSEERRRAYLCDITYGTNNEFGFDYLRDNMVRSMDELVQRKHHYAMVDEVDSVLIDDARTPLIISGPVSKGAEEEEYEMLKPSVERLIEAQRRIMTDYLAEARRLFKENVLGHEEGTAGLALFRVYRGLPKYRPLIKFLSEEGTKVLLQKTENFYMQEQQKNMHIADEPLLFTIDEKNRQVDLTEKGAEFLAKGGEDPNFFILPDLAVRLNEIESGTDMSKEERAEAKESLIQEYSQKSKRLHSIHQLLKAYTLFEKDEEYVVLDGEVKIVDEQTGRIMEGRRYSDGLHQALEAKEGVKVGEVTQTYATVSLQNYFRMYHKLAGMTGTAETEAKELWEIYKLDVVVVPTNRPVVRKDMEDLVYKTSREKYNAVIEEIVKLTEAGRPVLVGTTSVDISEKLSRMLQLRNIRHNVLNAKQHQREAEIVAEAGKKSNVTIATNMAGRGTDIKINQEVKEAGGLAIIGTERHESRRVDRQLRGRSGRQGDPGTSQFFVSLEDNLMRLFQSERIASLMDRLGHKDGEMIQHSMVTKSIERAQKKVEENNFGMRKRLLEYDDVMNIQREAIYRKRKNALSGERLSVDLYHMFSGICENLVNNHHPQGNYEAFRDASIRLLGLDPEMDPQDFKNSSAQRVTESFEELFREHYHRKTSKMIDILLPIVESVFQNEGSRYRYIAIPYSDGSAHQLPLSAHLENAVKSKGQTIITDIEKTVTLSILDEEWKEHLRAMDELKDSVQGASFEQKDPLVVYKLEAYELFEQLVARINEKVSSYLLNGKLLIQSDENVREARVQRTDLSKVSTNRNEPDPAKAAAAAAGGSNMSRPQTIVRTEQKIGRNDPCPCGSGKKFKHCHGK